MISQKSDIDYSIIMMVRYIGKKDTIAFDRNKLYTVLSIEKGWYRIMTELDEDYLFPPDVFEIEDEKKRDFKNLGIVKI